MRATLVVLFVLAMIHRSAPAQSSCSFDTSARQGIPDTLVIALTPGPRIGYKRELQADYLGAADAIRQQYRAPQSIWMPLWARWVGDGAKTDVDASDDPPRGFDGEVRFRLDATGRLASDTIAVETLNDDLAASVVAAIRRADSTASFTPPSKKLLREHGVIRLHFITPRTGSAQSAPLLRVIVPTVHLDHGPELQSRPPLSYPSELREAHISGRVTLQFVVGSDGQPVQPSLSVVKAEYREFVIEALHGASGMRFKPGRTGDCDVPVLVRLPVDFTIR